MKLFHLDPKLRTLYEYLSVNVSSLTPECKGNPVVASSEKCAPSLDKAASTIQSLWRKHKLRQALFEDPYHTYLSFIEDEDEKRLFAIMFGRHVSEVHAGSKDRAQNPYIYKGALYHRTDDLKGFLMDHLLAEFGVSDDMKSKNEFIPLTTLHNMPLNEILDQYIPQTNPKPMILRKKEYTLVLLAIPKNNWRIEQIKLNIQACGIIATPWEIAQNIKGLQFKTTISQLVLDQELPDSKAKLLSSKIFQKLSAIESSKRHPTAKLANCLKSLISNMPELDSRAMQRISLMLDLCNIFYEYHYARYAFGVYVLIHEITVALIRWQDTAFLTKEFALFCAESKNTLLKSLGIHEEALSNASFIVSPAISGSSAYMFAMRLANNMRIKSGNEPKIRVFEPSYYEYKDITKTSIFADADILVISAGPIVNIEGLTPGIDINQFVRRRIIAPNLDRPVTLIIDTTTTLYRNLHLTADVRKLIEAGKLSIIIFESKQKFGLIHTDQAQYGSVFGLCSKQSYDAEIIDDFLKNAQRDFNEHIDMQVGAIITNHCSELEGIKEQHYSNGAMMRNLLVQTSFAIKEIVTHDDMLDNLDELYFVTAHEAKALKVTSKVISSRDSFGHFSTTTSGLLDKMRISPDASDTIDCLIQTSQLYLLQNFTVEQQLNIIIENTHTIQSLPLEEKIIILALLNNIICKSSLDDKIISKNLLALYSAVHYIMQLCASLRGRQYYVNGYSFLHELRKVIKIKFTPKDCRAFMESVRVLQARAIPISNELVFQLANYPDLSAYIASHHDKISIQGILTLVALAEVGCQQYHLLANESFCKSILKVKCANDAILTSLLDAPHKYQEAKSYKLKYLSTCYRALTDFYQKDNATAADTMTVIKILDNEKMNYNENVLAKDRNAATKAARLFSEGVQSLSIKLTESITFYADYKLSGRTSFFSGTKSQNMLHTNHQELNDYLLSGKNFNVTIAQHGLSSGH